MILAQGNNSETSSLLTYYSYTKVLNATNETKNTYSQGTQISLLAVGIYLFNLIDAYYFYDYTVPVSERYKKPSLSIQFYKSNPAISHLPADSRYEIIYRWNL